MDKWQPSTGPDLTLIRLSSELTRLRDLWVGVSEILTEMQLSIAEEQRDEIVAEVERYLCRLREAAS